MLLTWHSVKEDLIVLLGPFLNMCGCRPNQRKTRRRCPSQVQAISQIYIHYPDPIYLWAICIKSQERKGNRKTGSDDQNRMTEKIKTIRLKIFEQRTKITQNRWPNNYLPNIFLTGQKVKLSAMYVTQVSDFVWEIVDVAFLSSEPSSFVLILHSCLSHIPLLPIVVLRFTFRFFSLLASLIPYLTSCRLFCEKEMIGNAGIWTANQEWQSSVLTTRPLDHATFFCICVSYGHFFTSFGPLVFYLFGPLYSVNGPSPIEKECALKKDLVVWTGYKTTGQNCFQQT